MDQRKKSIEKKLIKVIFSKDKIAQSKKIRVQLHLAWHARGNLPIDGNIVKGYN